MEVFKKKFFLSISFTICFLSLKAQDWQFQMGDEWFNQNQGLKVGDKMPDIPLGTVINNYTGKTNFSDFRGKLVILDMWSTHCSSCIALFPHMEELQKKFGDKIQIFIVNPYESKERIDNAFKARDSGRLTHTKLPNLPCIVGPTKLLDLFPARFVPHHIWIDGDGIIRVIGSELDTYEKKINDLLAGKTITQINDNDNTPNFNSQIPYCTIIGEEFKPGQNQVFFTPYNRDYSAKSPGYSEEITDSQHTVVRYTWVNTNLLDIYMDIFKKNTNALRKKILFASTGSYAIPYQLDVRDTSRYTSDYISSYADNFLLTDTDFIKSKFCYEVVMRMGLSEKERADYMLNELNKLVRNLYGTNAKLENRATNCYVLVRKSKKMNFKSVSKEKGCKEFVQNDRKMFQISQLSIKNAIDRVMSSEFRDWAYAQSKEGPFLFLDETEYTDFVDMILPEVNSIKELRSALKRYDMDIIQTTREIPWLMIQEK